METKDLINKEQVLALFKGNTKDKVKILLELSEQLQSKENLVNALKLKKEEAEFLLDSWEIREMKKISEEEVEGKKVYSNESLRKAELERRKELAQEVKEFRKTSDSAKYDYQMSESELKYFERVFKILMVEERRI